MSNVKCQVPSVKCKMSNAYADPWDTSTPDIRFHRAGSQLKIILGSTSKTTAEKKPLQYTQKNHVGNA